MGSVTKLARLLADQAAATQSMNTVPQLPASSVVDDSLDFTALVDSGEVDELGEPILVEMPMASIGLQEDGSVTLVVLDGPEPRSPTGLGAQAGIHSVVVSWPGTFDGELAADFDHVVAHLAEKSLVDADTVVFPSDVTTAGTFRSLQGGTLSLPGETGIAYYVGLVTVSQSGKWSPISEVLTVTPKGVLDDTDLAARLATSPRFYTATVPPPATDVPAMSWWLKADGTAWQYVDGAWAQKSGTVTGAVTASQVLALLMAAASATIGDLSADSATIQNLYAQAFTAATAAIGLVRADRIIAGALDAYTITGVVINGGTITGATFRTANSGRRLEFTTDGLTKFSSTNDAIFGVDTSTDDALIFFGRRNALGQKWTEVTDDGIAWKRRLSAPFGDFKFDGAMYRDDQTGDIVITSASAAEMFRIDNASATLALGGYPKAYTSELSADRSLSNMNYYSFKMVTLNETNGIPDLVSWSSDQLIIGEEGWYEITCSAGFSNASTSGNRVLILLKNFPTTPYNSATIPATEYRLAESKVAASSDTTSCLVVWKGRLVQGDTLMFIARTSSATGLLGGYRTRLTVEKRGE